MANSFILRIDDRSKEVLVESIRERLVAAEKRILSGDYSQEAMLAYEEYTILIKGLICARPYVDEEKTGIESVDVDLS